MSQHTTSRTTSYLPQVAAATTLVMIVPLVIVWLLLDEGVISSPWVCVGVAIALSIGATLLGSAYWKRRGGHGDVFFSELLLWGWLHRLRSEKRLNSAVGRLGLGDPDQDLAGGETTPERKAQLLRQMAAALDAQDPYTDGHSRRVALHSEMVARRMHVPQEEVAKIRTAAAVHDIGKLRIPREVLDKPEPLTSDEFELVKRHADAGAEIVSSMEDPEITAMVRHHHERFDGGGYPTGLVGEQTPFGARVIAVADTFDALTSVRPYRAAISHKRALDVIAAASGTQLDPVVVRTFLRCYSSNRATVFWTLLAISPSRAIALLRGRGAGPGNLASAATIAAPAALAAVFGIALGSSARVFSHYPLTAAKPPQVAGTTIVRPHHARARPRHVTRKDPKPIAVAARPTRHAVLGASAVRPHVRGGGGTAATGKHPAAPRAEPPHPVVRRTTHHPAPAKPRPPASPPGNASPPANTSPPSNTSSPTAPPSVPSGSSGTPPTKDECKNGGYAGYGFSNQGQCVASAEHGSH